MTLLIAHAGCEGTMNGSLESLHAAVNSGADAIEVDLQYHMGGIIYAHDLDENRPHDGCVLLDQILDLIEPTSVILACDIKTAAAFFPVLDRLKQRNMDERVIFSGNVPIQPFQARSYRYCINLEFIHNLEEGRVLCEEDLPRLIDFYEGHRSETLAGFNINYRWLTPKVVQRLMDADIGLWTWTVDDPDAMQWLLTSGISGITTNRIVAAIALAENMRQKSGYRTTAG